MVGAVRFELIFGVRRNTLKTKDDHTDQAFRPFVQGESRSIKMNVNHSFQLGIVRKNLLLDKHCLAAQQFIFAEEPHVANPETDSARELVPLVSGHPSSG